MDIVHKRDDVGRQTNGDVRILRHQSVNIFFWRHKILNSLCQMEVTVELEGISECDETFFALSYKGNSVMVSAIGTLHLAAFIDDLLLILLQFFQNDKSYWYLL